MTRFRVDDAVYLHYEEKGKGRPVLFVHGVCMSSRFFHRQMPYFGERHRAIALDLRGHGRSARVHRGHTVATYAQDLRAFIRGQKLKDAVLVGWSMGCLVVWDYFKQFGAENVGAAVFVEQSASDFKWPSWEFGLFDLPALIHLMSEVQTDQEKLFKDFVPMMFNEPPSDEDLHWMVQENLKLPATIASAILFDQTVQDYREELSKVTVPSLIVFGSSKNKLIPAAAGRHLRDNIPNSRLLLFENSNHCPFLEEPERFNEEVDRFIRSLGRSR